MKGLLGASCLCLGRWLQAHLSIGSWASASTGHPVLFPQDALESAMKHGLWGHALLLASKMDSRTHARVMTRCVCVGGGKGALPALVSAPLLLSDPNPAATAGSLLRATTPTMHLEGARGLSRQAQRSLLSSHPRPACLPRFANSLPINDPLQTVYQLMSGRMPAASTVSLRSGPGVETPCARRCLSWIEPRGVLGIPPLGPAFAPPPAPVFGRSPGLRPLPGLPTQALPSPLSSAVEMRSGGTGGPTWPWSCPT